MLLEQVAKSTAIELIVFIHPFIHSLTMPKLQQRQNKIKPSRSRTNHNSASKRYTVHIETKVAICPLRSYDRGKGILFADDEFLMLVGDVALDLALVDEIGEETFALFGVDVFFRQDGPQRRHEGGNRQLRHGQDEIDFLEEVPHRDGLEFLQDQVDAAFDEEGLVLDERLIQAPQIARFYAARYFRKRR